MVNFFSYRLIFGILPLICCGCSSIYDYSSEVVDYYFYPDTQTFHITTLETTNGHRPVYLLIKSTDFAHFILDDYPAIVAAIDNPSEDPANLATFCLLPGTTTSCEFKVPPGKGLGFYALYTNPKQDWKYLINTKQTFHTVNVRLGEHEIESVELE
ncbi:MAG: hypothetical protein LLG04_13480 [Parachlamydia sp.]|nr:hypothetical protein [Parachlamydia sp.]